MFARTKWNECYKFKFTEIERRERKREKYKHSTQFDIIFIRNRDTFPPKPGPGPGNDCVSLKVITYFRNCPRKKKSVYEFVYVYFNRDRHTFVKSEIHPIKWLEIKLHGPTNERTNEWKKKEKCLSIINFMLALLMRLIFYSNISRFVRVSIHYFAS